MPTTGTASAACSPRTSDSTWSRTERQPGGARSARTSPTTSARPAGKCSRHGSKTARCWRCGSAADAPPRYFIALGWRDGEVVAIRDFRYVPYIAQDGTIALEAAA